MGRFFSQLLFQRWFSGLLLVVALGAGGFWLVRWFNGQGVFNLEKVAVHQVNRLYVDSLIQNKMTGLQKELEEFKGQSLLDLNLRAVRDRVLNEPWVESVVFSRQWPETLDVSIVAKAVEAVLLQKDGLLSPVMAGGDLLSPSREAGVLNLVVFRGSLLQRDKGLRGRALELLDFLPKEGVLTKKVVSDMEYDKKDGFSLSLVGSGTQIIMGQGLVDEKLKRVVRVLEYLESRKVRGRIVDARLSKKVLVKLRKSQ